MAFKELNVENEKANIDHTKAAVLLRILVVLFVESVICIILGYGGYLVYQGQFNAGELMEFIGYFTAVVWPITAVSELIDMTSRGKASLDRISELLDAKQDVTDRPGVPDLAGIKGDIEFRDLTFRYPDGEYDVLQNVSFTIHAGENIGLVGKTGSGKTTLVDLILRTYNVPDGTIFIDGHDVNDVTIRSVREGCAYVPQDNFLFSDTIEHNISFGVEDYEEDSIVEAAALADIHSNISQFQMGYDTVLGERGVTVSGGQKQRISIARALMKNAPILILDDSVSAVDTKMGYDTVLGERGVTVSGGQKQRISIARALMKNAPILILDDSVSAVDTKTERTILANLHTTRAGKTTILIAHRISTIEQMDKILYVEDGRVAAFGPHAELMQTCSGYRKMVELQQLEEEGGDHNG